MPQPDTEASSTAVTPDPNCSAQHTPDVGPSNTLQLVPGLSLTMDQAEEYLNIYRTRMVPHFPFIPIHVNVTARELHSQKRFLFWCIMQALVPQEAPVQKAVDDWIRHHAAVHVIVNRERKLELLQGLSLFPIYDRDEDTPAPFFKEHYSAIFSSVQKEMEDLQKEEPGINKDNPLVWCHYVTLAVRLYEPALGMRPMSPADTASPTEPYSRTDALWKCLECVQAAMDALMSIPAEIYAYLPFTLVSSTAFVMMAANRLLLEDGSPDWDVTIARQKIPHAENTQRMADRFEEADNVALVVGQKRRLFEDQTSRWANYAYRARWMKNWYLSKVSPPQREPSAEQPPNTAEGSTNDPSMSWVDDVTMDKMFWGQMIVDGFGQMPYDFQFGNDSMQTLQGIMWQDGMSTTETMAMANMIPQ
ncbi:hypothetical protein N0V92_004378 [Colletotrichum tropicale]|nr:hypothetical protein N0V92_004378 [Colletotrichum tropicale]